MLIEITINTCTDSYAREHNKLTLLQETREQERYEMAEMHPAAWASSCVQIERLASCILVD